MNLNYHYSVPSTSLWSEEENVAEKNLVGMMVKRNTSTNYLRIKKSDNPAAQS